MFSSFGMGTMEQVEQSMYSLMKMGFALVSICIVYAVISIIFSLGTGYDTHSGYGYRRYWGGGYMPHSRSGGSSSFSGKIGGKGCACACAGGGRAGCSKKDFYGTNIKTINLKNILTN